MAIATSELAAEIRARRVGALGPYVVRLAVLTGLYYGSARLGYWVGFSGPVASIVWLPVGVAVAFLSLEGLAYWPGVLAGDLLANNYGTLPVGGALGQTCGNMLEVLVAAALIRQLLRRGSPLASRRGVVALLGAIGAGTLISALVGPISLILSGVISASSLWTVARTWWLGDFCGALVVVPFALAWRGPLNLRFTARRTFEAVILIALLASLIEFASRTREPVMYLIFPALIWAVLRFGQRGGTFATR